MRYYYKCLFAALTGITLLSSCSRPVAYFQKTPYQSLATKTQSAPVSAPTESVAARLDEATREPIAPERIETTADLAQQNALASSQANAVADKSVQQRIDRVKTLLASRKETASTAPAQPQKMNLMQRMVVKTMNKRIAKQLAPKHPNRTMANTTILATGAVVVLIGLLILLLGSSGTAGTIILLAGAVILLVGLLT